MSCLSSEKMQISAIVVLKNGVKSAFEKLPQDKLQAVFLNGKRFLNMEIIYPGTQNVVMYGPQAYLQFHGIDEYDLELKTVLTGETNVTQVEDQQHGPIHVWKNANHFWVVESTKKVFLKNRKIREIVESHFIINILRFFKIPAFSFAICLI